MVVGKTAPVCRTILFGNPSKLGDVGSFRKIQEKLKTKLSKLLNLTRSVFFYRIRDQIRDPGSARSEIQDPGPFLAVARSGIRIRFQRILAWPDPRSGSVSRYFWRGQIRDPGSVFRYFWGGQIRDPDPIFFRPFLKTLCNSEIPPPAHTGAGFDLQWSGLCCRGHRTFVWMFWGF